MAARPDVSSGGRHEIALYNGGGIVYGVGGGDATRAPHNAIATTCGAGGVLSVRGHDLATRRLAVR